MNNKLIQNCLLWTKSNLYGIICFKANSSRPKMDLLNTNDAENREGNSRKKMRKCRKKVIGATSFKQKYGINNLVLKILL